ncbi:helix-turn-helix transcriptional regulator [Glycomyces albus]
MWPVVLSATMTDMPSNPRFDSWVIRMTLNQLYEQHGFDSTREGARFLFMNKSTLDRILTGKTMRHDPTRIQGMAKRLGASDAVANQLFELAVQTHSNDASGFRHSRRPGEVSKGSPFSMVEAAADRLDIYEDNLVTGLLQTVEYMRALIESSPFVDSEAQARGIIDYKQNRQRAVFGDGNPPEMRVVLNEHVLQQMKHLPLYGAQIAHLRKITDQYDIGVYIHPTAAGLNPAESGAFTLMGFDNPVDLEVAFLDAYAGGSWVEDRDSIKQFRKLFKVILQRSVELVRRRKFVV